MKKITTEEELKKAIETNDVVVCKFGADWCGPCKVLGKTISDIESENIDSAEFIEIDVNEVDADFLGKHGIRTIPVLEYYANGEAVDRTTGLVTKQELLDKINSYKKQ